MLDGEAAEPPDAGTDPCGVGDATADDSTGATGIDGGGGPGVASSPASPARRANPETSRANNTSNDTAASSRSCGRRVRGGVSDGALVFS